jgi:hypothetical protein
VLPLREMKKGPSLIVDHFKGETPINRISLSQGRPEIKYNSPYKDEPPSNKNSNRNLSL